MKLTFTINFVQYCALESIVRDGQACQGNFYRSVLPAMNCPDEVCQLCQKEPIVPGKRRGTIDREIIERAALGEETQENTHATARERGDQIAPHPVTIDEEGVGVAAHDGNESVAGSIGSMDS